VNGDVEHQVTMQFLSTGEDSDCLQQAIDFLVERWPDMLLTRGAPEVHRRGPFVQVTVHFTSDNDWRPE
jgi:hypothetical protein